MLKYHQGASLSQLEAAESDQEVRQPGEAGGRQTGDGSWTRWRPQVERGSPGPY